MNVELKRSRGGRRSLRETSCVCAHFRRTLPNKPVSYDHENIRLLTICTAAAAALHFRVFTVRMAAGIFYRVHFKPKVLELIYTDTARNQRAVA